MTRLSRQKSETNSLLHESMLSLMSYQMSINGNQAYEVINQINKKEVEYKHTLRSARKPI